MNRWTGILDKLDICPTTNIPDPQSNQHILHTITMTRIRVMLPVLHTLGVVDICRHNILHVYWCMQSTVVDA